jgi:hypothetical protein
MIRDARDHWIESNALATEAERKRVCISERTRSTRMESLPEAVRSLRVKYTLPGLAYIIVTIKAATESVVSTNGYSQSRVDFLEAERRRWIISRFWSPLVNEPPSLSLETP